MLENLITCGTITACYNQGKFFKDCLNGILSQSIKPDKIMVIDDGSTDSSWSEILACFNIEDQKSQHEFAFKGSTVTLLQLPKNAGPSFARNVGLQYLVEKVKYIAIADADDIYYPDKISKSVEIMEKYPEVALVYSDYDIENLQNGTKNREYKEPFSFKRLFQECIVSNNSLFASNIIKQVGGYDNHLRYGEDYDLWLRMAELACMYHIPEALYSYRLTGENVTTTTSSENFAKHVNIVHQKAMQRRQQRMQS